MTHETLANYLETNFAVMHHHKWSLSDFENITPFEREIYVILLKEHLDTLILEAKQKAAAARHK